MNALPDHPRLCGANAILTKSTYFPFGSSPLVRGKLVSGVQDVFVLRIIPACAGQTRSWAATRTWTADHPRLCGANARLGPCAVSGLRCDRIIPACAGQTATISPGVWWRADHPRLCGANSWATLDSELANGSSPLVRGKHCGRPEAGQVARIIPACAGQTGYVIARWLFSSDHPRLCGANSTKGSPLTSVSGSSPLVRGKLLGTLAECEVGGIIPACAGQTPCSGKCRTRSSDHPRLCGANAVLMAPTAMPTGSSPLVRGKLTVLVAVSPYPRIIPACAGQTRACKPS